MRQGTFSCFRCFTVTMIRVATMVLGGSHALGDAEKVGKHLIIHASLEISWTADPFIAPSQHDFMS